MDYFSMRSADKSAPYVDEIVVNDLDGLNKIPVNSYNPGTICIVIADGSCYMLNLDKEWKPI